MAQNKDAIYGEGVLEILQDGFGFLSPLMLTIFQGQWAFPRKLNKIACGQEIL